MRALVSSTVAWGAVAVLEVAVVVLRRARMLGSPSISIDASQHAGAAGLAHAKARVPR
ncbi:MAG: hypothetical protein Q8R92_20980 [Deltaproteobacteria bacterium]|nr:hypothetical protein [Deltaproteobacteria bacterium]